jgi:HD-GYP domain-containing protein (c-di-GMP phosphodiesterase class II)
MTQRTSGAKTKVAASLSIPKEIASRRMDVGDWLALQKRAHALLVGEEADGFPSRFDALHAELRGQFRDHPDATLTTLLYLGSTEIDLYSATHSMLVSVLCGLTAREVLDWSDRDSETVEKAALSMNIEMTALQDNLARQVVRPSPEQQRLIDLHSVLSADLLLEFGIQDPLWLDAVRLHHDKAPGPLAQREPASRLARLIERADIYAARMAPRAGRAPMTPEVAMESCRLDERGQVDEAGAALIRAVGKFPPGSAVRLANRESGLVIGRSRSGGSPRVAILLDANGEPLKTPVVRNTGLRQFQVLASTAHRSLGSTTDLTKILRLV